MEVGCFIAEELQENLVKEANFVQEKDIMSF
jgi:hypothetical protein